MAQKTNELGEIAMELIADHPLYASTCGITFDEAIAIASVLFGSDLIGYKAECDRLDTLTPEHLKAEMEADRDS